MGDSPATQKHEHASRTILLVLASATVLLHLLCAGRYGYFRDELYYIACGRRLAWGYVDHPPLIAVLARLATGLFGDSLVGLRVLPALAAGGLVVLTGVVARQLGGGNWAIAIAGLGVALAPIFLFTGHTLTMNAFEPLFWLGCASLLLGLLQTDDRRSWVTIGLLVGVGLLNKHSMMFFAACLALGLALTPRRRVLLSKWLLVGAGLATIVVVPHVVWQVRNDLPQLEMLRNAALYKNARFALGDFLVGQLELMHPLYAPLWLGGLGYLLFAHAGRARVLGLAFLLLLALYVAMEAKAYYLAPAYPMLFAAGGCAVERALTARWARALVLVLVVLVGLASAPMSIPVLSQERFIAYQSALGLTPSSSERHETSVLPQHFADQHGWPELVATVAQVYAGLPADERERTVIYTQNYGEAGAIDWLGPAHGLPPARSGHNNYFLWGPGEVEAQVVLILGGDAEEHAAACGSLELAGRVPANPYVMPYEDRLPIFLCREPLQPLAELWPGVKHYE